MAPVVLSFQAHRAATCARPHAPRRPLGSRRRVCRPIAASGEGSEAGVPARSLTEAFAVLGLPEGSTYDAVLQAKNRLLERAGDNLERRMEVEAAYDMIFSSQLKRRLAGDLPVSTNVRFADVQRRRPAAPPSAPAAAAQKAQQLLGSLPGAALTVARPAPRTAATAAAVYGTLAAWTLAQGVLQPEPASAAADVPGLQLALATAATVYLLREQKRAGLGKAAGLALLGLVAGTFAGSAVQAWLRVDIIPLGPLSSPGALVAEFSIAGLAAVCLFLG